MKRWTIKNYSVFLRESRARYDLTGTQARMLYNEMRNKLGRQVFSADLKRHPRITKRALNKVEKESFRKREEDLIEREIDRVIDLNEDYEEYAGAIDYA